jgi:hypothetical protein
MCELPSLRRQNLSTWEWDREWGRRPRTDVAAARPVGGCRPLYSSQVKAAGHKLFSSSRSTRAMRSRFLCHRNSRRMGSSRERRTWRNRYQCYWVSSSFHITRSSFRMRDFLPSILPLVYTVKTERGKQQDSCVELAYCCRHFFFEEKNLLLPVIWIKGSIPLSTGFACILKSSIWQT